MKNNYLSYRQVNFANSVVPEQPVVTTLDTEATDMFENLNPVLSNGHRANLITRLVDKNVPREVADVISQLVSNVPHDSHTNYYSDEQIQAAIVSRHYQNEIELDMVRNALDEVSKELFPDEPTPTETKPSESIPPADPAPSDPT
ncbi:hypothetical protein KZO74_11225 [Prevotella salivae]|uniref:hypothetical protein n=1 Tax=Segatella salivae TaxID=228604 RepID=UPI001C5F1BF9|nr:hypothetical protein [Segatella salivae]MBW4765542.1 hypothetical protein [Segatella salivae]